MMHPMRRHDREVTDPAAICAILDACKTCHVAMFDGDEPYVVPLSYGYTLTDGELCLYIHCAHAGRKLDIWRREPRVCFDIAADGKLLISDDPCKSSRNFASIIGWGVAEVIENERDKCDALQILYHHQTGKLISFTTIEARMVTMVRIRSDRFSAKAR